MSIEILPSSCDEPFDYEETIFKSIQWNGRLLRCNPQAPIFPLLSLQSSDFLNSSPYLNSISNNFLNRTIQKIEFDEKGEFKSLGLRKFWKKHKKAIIVTLVVVVVAVVVTVAVCASGGAAATAAAAGTAAALDAIVDQGENQPDPASVESSFEAKQLYEHPFPSTFFEKHIPSDPPLAEKQEIPPTKECTPAEAQVVNEASANNSSSVQPSLLPANLPPIPEHLSEQMQFLEKGAILDGQFYPYDSLFYQSKLQALCPSLYPHLESDSVNAYQPPALSLEPFPLDTPTLPELPSLPAEPQKSWWSRFRDFVGFDPIDRDLLEVDSAQLDRPLSPRSKSFNIEGEKSKSIQIGGINGLNTSLDDATSHANYLKNFTQDQNIDWVYNCSHGVVSDFAEVLTLNYLGYSPNTAKLLQENWTTFDKENADNPKAKYLQFCHSQGALHVKNALLAAPKEIRDRVIVVAIAPASVIPSGLCFKSSNYACKKDIVPSGELGYISALDSTEFGVSKAVEQVLDARSELVLLDPGPDSPGMHHSFQDPIFEEHIKKQIRDYLLHGGEYEQEER